MPDRICPICGATLVVKETPTYEERKCPECRTKWIIPKDEPTE